MLILLALPVITLVAAIYSLVQGLAPSNLLVKRVRSARPSAPIAGALFGLTMVLLLATHAVADAVSAGAPRWLNVLALLLAWDSIKVAWLAVGVALRIAIGMTRRSLDCLLQTPERKGMTQAGQLARKDEDVAVRHSKGSIAPPWLTSQTSMPAAASGAAVAACRRR